jgi:CopG family nickel-responsive transcriptional regulator
MCTEFHGITIVETVPPGAPNRRARVATRAPAYNEGQMGELSRIGVAIDSELLRKFDDLIAKRGYTNRSEAFRDLIREELVEQAWESPERKVVGTVSIVYDHHVRLLNEKLTGLQHEHYHHVLSTLHVHLDHDHCLEVLVVRGKAAEVKRIADALIATKGVKHGRLTIATTGAEL